ncbi:MAG: glycosyltransferase family 2 protein [Planctomycetota bacterium]|nr:glycosyltransferase family 2 protein [Planctomycetota bacterium]
MRVSIILPTYNCFGLLGEAIACVLDQDLGDYELIVIDDGSTDATRQTVEAFADGRIRYLHQPNRGVYAARNAGLAMADGPYVAWLDSDDLWPRDYLSVMTAQLDRQSEYGVAYCPVVNVYPKGRRRDPTWYRTCPSGWVARSFFRKCRLLLPSMLMRRDALAGMRCDESLRTLGDLDLGLRLACRTKFLFIPDVCLTRRLRRESLSQHVDCRQLDINKIRVLERFYRHLGGSAHVPRSLARRVLSKAYLAAAREFYGYGAWSAARTLFGRALAHRRLSPSAWLGRARAALKPAPTAALPDWPEPPPIASPGPSVRPT